MVSLLSREAPVEAVEQAQPPLFGLSPFLDALPLSLREQLEQLCASLDLGLERSSSLVALQALPTPTEEDSCSCATCGSTCCDLV